MTIRIISRLDVKPPNLVKGIHLEGFRKIGNPADYALNYFEAGADEIMYQDIVASLYGRNTLTNLINETAKNLFIPLNTNHYHANAVSLLQIILNKLFVY